eukprot:8051490-Pyramimonas_sp.AAC.1
MARENMWLRSCAELWVRCVAQAVPACWILPVSPSVDPATPVAGMPPEVAALPRLPGCRGTLLDTCPHVDPGVAPS